MNTYKQLQRQIKFLRNKLSTVRKRDRVRKALEVWRNDAPGRAWTLASPRRNTWAVLLVESSFDPSFTVKRAQGRGDTPDEALAAALADFGIKGASNGA